MPNLNLGRTLVIANPTSHSGRGRMAAMRAQRFFNSYSSISTSFEMLLTKGPKDATLMAEDAQDYDTVIALGGDGVIHETINGLMNIPSDKRPTLAVIPMGSGNDFARTLNATYNAPDTSLAEIFSGHHRNFDLGKITNELGESTYFMETLSFGLDAAVSVDTTIRRADHAKQEGSALFATSGLKIMARGHKGYQAHLSLSTNQSYDLPCIVLVANIGPTYGGGFMICPDARPNDGLLSMCFNTKRPSIPHLLALFGLARTGLHTHSSIITTAEVTSFEVSFSDPLVPCQTDGEVFQGQSYKVSICPHELDVIVPAQCRW